VRYGIEVGPEDIGGLSQQACTALAEEEPASAGRDALAETHHVLPGPCDQTCCSIVNMLQLVHDRLRRGRQNRVAIVDARCDKGVD